MFDSQDRRSALMKLVGGAGIAGVALTEALTGASAAVDAEKHKNKKRKKPEQIWSGRLVNPVYTPIGSGDTKHYHITAQGGGDGTMDDSKRDKKVKMTDARLFKYMEKKSGGNYSGLQCLRLQGMNWRLLGADYTKSTNTWVLDVEVCDSNPDKRPNSQAGDEAWGDEVSGCSCGCGFKCYQCRRGQNCGSSFKEACSEDLKSALR